MEDQPLAKRAEMLRQALEGFDGQRLDVGKRGRIEVTQVGKVTGGSRGECWSCRCCSILTPIPMARRCTCRLLSMKLVAKLAMLALWRHLPAAAADCPRHLPTPSSRRARRPTITVTPREKIPGIDWYDPLRWRQPTPAEARALSRYQRDCVGWYALEHRPSGTVITPQDALPLGAALRS